MRLSYRLLPVIANLAACGGWGLDVDPPEYTVSGIIQPEFAGDPLPPPSAMRVDVIDGWEHDDDPFPVDAPLLGEATIFTDGSFHAHVEEDDHVGQIAVAIVDDAVGAPDLLVATINDRHLDADRVAVIDGYVIPRARLDAWKASPALAGRDPEAEGAALLTFLDRDRQPAAGVDALANALGAGADVEVFYLDDAGMAIVDGATATTASGKVLVMDARGFDTYGTDQPALDDLTHDHVGCGMRPGAIFVETVSQLDLATYDVHGRVAPLVAGDAQGSIDLRVLDVWERWSAPVADDVPVVATPTLDGTGAFSARVTEDSDALVAAVVVDDAAGAPDLLVPTITTSSVVADALPVVTISHARAAGWQASPALAGHDLVAEGSAIVTFVDDQGRPAAGVQPVALFSGPIYYLSADGASIVAGATTTTASGRVLLLGQPFLVTGYGVDGQVSHRGDFVGTRPGAITHVTLGPQPPEPQP